MSRHHQIFPRNPMPPHEGFDHRNLGFLQTGDDGYYIVSTLTFFEQNVSRASEAELDMFYLIVRAHRRRWLWKSIVGLIMLGVFLSIPFYFLPRATNGLWPFN